jgi:hypothetical protein
MAREILVTLLARSSPPFKLPLSELSHVPIYTPSVSLKFHLIFANISLRQDIDDEQEDILPSEHIISRLVDEYLGRRMSRVSLALDSSRS